MTPGRLIGGGAGGFLLAGVIATSGAGETSDAVQLAAGLLALGSLGALGAGVLFAPVRALRSRGQRRRARMAALDVPTPEPDIWVVTAVRREDGTELMEVRELDGTRELVVDVDLNAGWSDPAPAVGSQLVLNHVEEADGWIEFQDASREFEPDPDLRDPVLVTGHVVEERAVAEAEAPPPAWPTT